ncbi:MAG: hypothetical protein ABSG96_06175 [Terracidiphilus sp.]|jgi:hypothetical protein
MNIEDRQQPRHAPQGTSAALFPDRNEFSVTRSHAEKLPAFKSTGPSDASFF